MKRKIIIASHHKLAYGMNETIKFLSGVQDCKVVSAYVEETEATQEIEESVNDLADYEEVFIFTDMLGGSVTQQYSPYINDQVHLICGMNLPLILTVALSGDQTFNEERINTVIEEAKQSIVYVNTYDVLNDDDDE